MDFEQHGDTMGYTWFLGEITEGQVPHIGEPDVFKEYLYVPLTQLREYRLSSNMHNFVQELEKGNLGMNILITGPSGAGKSYVSSLLAKEGIPTVDTDEIDGLSSWFNAGKKVVPSCVMDKEF